MVDDPLMGGFQPPILLEKENTLLNDEQISKINQSSVLQSPIKRISIKLDENTVFYFPESAVVVEANDAVVEVLDQLCIPCTLKSLRRRLEARGFFASDEELYDLIRKLAGRNCIKVDGNYRYDLDKGEVSVAGEMTNMKAVALHVTHTCNLNCRYCYNSKYRSAHKKDELTYSQWERIIDEAMEMGVREYVVTGGEPLLREELLPLFAKYRSSKFAAFRLITNGTLVTSENSREISDAFVEVSVSIDSCEEDTNDYYRGNGSFKAAVNAIELLKSCQVNVNANVVLTKKTINHYQKTKTFLKSIGCNYIIPMVMQSAEEKALKHRPSKEQIEFFVDSNYEALQRDCSFEELNRDTKLGWVGYKISCGAAAAEGAISADGKLYPCRMLMFDELSAGSVVENGLRECWENSHVFNEIRGFDYRNIKECHECEFFGLCIGGCRAVAYSRTGRIDGWIGEDFCHEQKQRFRHKLVIGVKAEKERN